MPLSTGLGLTVAITGTPPYGQFMTFVHRPLSPHELYSHEVRMRRAKVSARGQLSLPAAVRRRWSTGRVLILDKGDYVLIRPIPDDPVAELRGSIPKDDKSLNEYRAHERSLEASIEQARWSSSTQSQS